MDTETQEPVSIPRYSSGRNASITFSNLTAEEAEKLRGMVTGHWWARGNSGRIEFAHGMETPAAPIEDVMLPQWRRPSDDEQEIEYQLELLDPDCNLQNRSPSILIQALCGYGYTPDGYKSNAAALERFGFACMRSRRGDDGHYWEIWFLPGFYAAKGQLKEAIHDMGQEVTMEKVLDFIRWQVSFGTLDVSVQRMCQVMD
ncbi:hypothetical protein BH11PAT2_BH11PAT2_05910 [soil metagenome]